MSTGSRHLTFTPLADGRVEVGRGRDAVPLSLIIDHSCRVYITQIPLERIERDGANALRAEFEVFGPVESYKMFTEKSGRFIGSVLCTYRNPADASAAVHNMNGQIIDGSVLKVSLSRDHGVVLLHQTGSKSRHSDGDYADSEGKWQHDQYEALIEGRGGDTFGDNLYRRGGRGGRGWGHRGRGGRRCTDSVEEAFERYIASRDKAIIESNKSLDNSGGVNATGGDKVLCENRTEEKGKVTNFTHSNNETEGGDGNSHTALEPVGDLEVLKNEES